MFRTLISGAVLSRNSGCGQIIDKSNIKDHLQLGSGLSIKSEGYSLLLVVTLLMLVRFSLSGFLFDILGLDFELYFSLCFL